MSTKISVIMPSLNVVSYIEESVKSVLNQTFRDIEILCVDAGSTDGTLEKIKKISLDDKRVILIKSDIKSYGHQVNLGINFAKSEYISIVETDDFICENMLEKLYECVTNNNCDIVKCDYNAYYTQENGKRVFLKRSSCDNEEIYKQIIKPIDYIGLGNSDWYLWTGIYKKSFIKENNIYLSDTKGAAFQDIGFLHKTLVRAKKCIYIKGNYYNYCIDRESASSNVGKGLLYSYQEFTKLLDEEWNREELSFLYVRMSKSVVSCMKNLKRKNIDDNSILILNWFREHIVKAFDNGLLCEEKIQKYVWNTLQYLLKSVNEFINKTFIREKNIENLLKNRNEYKIIIFGCGNIGYETFRWIKQNDYNVFAFMDNNPELWGSILNGCPILNPKAANEIVDGKFIIANEVYGDSIKQQLLNMNIRHENICSFL